ncbi:MAG: hypothetical protein OJF60_002572 [Burkholderiaceae bacterium]|nr:MAG: hypothetical protein OJF60_002572 [Burkholderiaceae bacterium]
MYQIVPRNSVQTLVHIQENAGGLPWIKLGSCWLRYGAAQSARIPRRSPEPRSEG